MAHFKGGTGVFVMGSETEAPPTENAMTPEAALLD